MELLVFGKETICSVSFFISNSDLFDPFEVERFHEGKETDEFTKKARECHFAVR